MPNIYYSSPSTPFAAGTAGFLSSMEKFTKLNIDQQRTDIASKAQKDTSRQRDDENALRERGLNLDIAREFRIGSPEQFPQQAYEQAHKVLRELEGVPEYQSYVARQRLELDGPNANPLGVLEDSEKVRDKAVYQARIEQRWEQILKDGKESLDGMDEMFGRLGLSPLTETERETFELQLTQMGMFPDDDPAGFDRDFNDGLTRLRQQRQAQVQSQQQMLQETAPPQQPQEPQGDGNLMEGMKLFQYIRKLGDQKGAPKEVKSETDAFMEQLLEGLPDEEPKKDS